MAGSSAVIMKFTVAKENRCFLVHEYKSHQREFSPRHKTHKSWGKE